MTSTFVKAIIVPNLKSLRINVSLCLLRAHLLQFTMVN